MAWRATLIWQVMNTAMTGNPVVLLIDSGGAASAIAAYAKNEKIEDRDRARTHSALSHRYTPPCISPSVHY